MKKDLEKKDAKRKLILKEAHNLFVYRGIHKTKMIDISTACGISKGLLYFYFENKDSIAWEIIMQYSDMAYDKARIYIESLKGSGYERLRHTIQSIVQSTIQSYSSQSPGYRFREYMFEVLSKETVKEQYVQDYQESLAKNTKLYADLIRDGIKDGSIKPSVDSNMVAQTIATALSLYIRHMTAMKDGSTKFMQTDREQELCCLMELLLDGIVAN